jgi:hypothetical protein
MTTALDRALAWTAKRSSARADAIAAHLQMSAEMVDKLLQPAVESGYLVACQVQRPGKAPVMEYRVSLAAIGATKPMAFGEYQVIARPRGAPTPLKQPQAARRQIAPPAPNMEPVMAKEKITRQQVLAAIVAAGKDGISRKALAEQFSSPESNMDMHISALNRQQPPVLFKPERGHLVAIEFQDVDNPSTQKLATWQVVFNWLSKNDPGSAAMPAAIAAGIDCTEESTRKVLLGMFAGMKCDRIKTPDGDFAYFIGEAPAIAKSTPETVALLTTASQPIAGPAMSETEIADFVNNLEPEPDTWPNAAPADSRPAFELTAPAGFDEIVMTDAEATEMAIWSNGALTIDDGAVTVQLSAQVARKLRNYLGLFEGSATC